MKNNLEVFNGFDQSSAHSIDKLFWIACSMESRELKDLVEEIDLDEIKELFPEVIDGVHFDEYIDGEEFLGVLYDFRKLGFIAEYHVPEYSHFRLDSEGNPVAWRVDSGVCRILYAYAETTQELLTIIIEKSQSIFQESLLEWKNSRITE